MFMQRFGQQWTSLAEGVGVSDGSLSRPRTTELARENA